MTQPESGRRRSSGVGAAVGSAVGAAVGAVLLDEPAIGLAVGAALGAVLVALWGAFPAR